MPATFSTERAALVKRSRLFMGLAALPWLLVLAEAVAAVTLGLPQLLVTAPHLFFGGAALLVYMYRRNPSPRHAPCKLDVGREGVRVDGQLVVPRAQIKSAFVMPRGAEAPVVRIRRKGLRLPFDVRVTDREEGREVLKALGLDASQSVATFRLPSELLRTGPGLKWFGGAMAAGMLFMIFAMAIATRITPALIPIAPVFMAIAAFSTVILGNLPTKLQVGADGLHLAVAFKKPRFIGFGEIARIDPFEDPGSNKSALMGLLLHLKNGEQLRLPVMTKRSHVRDEVHILHERIAEAVDLWQRGSGVADAALVQRGHREPSEWVRALRSIGAGSNADARTAPVMPERLWRIVEDPAAPADARAGAAVALGLGADDEARARLQAAASATAAPKLRFAIETAAAPSSPAQDDALTAALAEIESTSASAASAPATIALAGPPPPR